MREPSPLEKKMWRETLHVQMRMILRCLENGDPVPYGLRERTYTEEYRTHFNRKRLEYIAHLGALPSPVEKSPAYAVVYAKRVRAHAEALDKIRKELKHLNRRVDMDDSQKRQKRPDIIRRYTELRRAFKTWLDEWEAETGYWSGPQIHFCKPSLGEPDYRWGLQYRWYYRFQTVAEHNRVDTVEEAAIAEEISTLRWFLENDGK